MTTSTVPLVPTVADKTCWGDKQAVLRASRVILAADAGRSGVAELGPCSDHLVRERAGSSVIASHANTGYPSTFARS